MASSISGISIAQVRRSPPSRRRAAPAPSGQADFSARKVVAGPMKPRLNSTASAATMKKITNAAAVGLRRKIMYPPTNPPRSTIACNPS